MEQLEHLSGNYSKYKKTISIYLLCGQLLKVYLIYIDKDR